ncbi:MAG TPA: hypothetical protein VH370_23370 [Humisphaera sp.]|jgi:hypothetical protein|nr:hypothetical protein [Humisphaera sp.]
MSDLNWLGLRSFHRRGRMGTPTEHVMLRRPLSRVLAFRGRSIDDVVNDPIVKNEIFGYWKLYRAIERHGEVTDLERQWNPLGERT